MNEGLAAKLPVGLGLALEPLAEVWVYLAAT